MGSVHAQHGQAVLAEARYVLLKNMRYFSRPQDPICTVFAGAGGFSD
jgi:hypothetical protein